MAQLCAIPFQKTGFLQTGSTPLPPRCWSICQCRIGMSTTAAPITRGPRSSTIGSSRNTQSRLSISWPIRCLSAASTSTTGPTNPMPIISNQDWTAPIALPIPTTICSNAGRRLSPSIALRHWAIARSWPCDSAGRVFLTTIRWQRLSTRQHWGSRRHSWTRFL